MTMAQALLKVLSAQGVETVFVDGSWLFVGPEEVLTDEVCKLLGEQKVELYELLAGTDSNCQEMTSGEELFPDLFPEPDPFDECWNLCLQCGAKACVYDRDDQPFCGNGCYRAYHRQVLPEPACDTPEASCELDLASIGRQSSTGCNQSLEKCLANALVEDQRVIQGDAGDAGGAGGISVGSQGEKLRWFESSAGGAGGAGFSP